MIIQLENIYKKTLNSQINRVTEKLETRNNRTLLYILNNIMF